MQQYQSQDGNAWTAKVDTIGCILQGVKLNVTISGDMCSAHNSNFTDVKVWY